MSQEGADSPFSGTALNSEALFADLVRRFEGRLRLFAARQVQDPWLAEDVAQEALGRVLEALRTGRVGNPHALPAFVYQTARHICLHHLRARGREGRALRLWSRSRTEIDPEADPLAAMIDAEARARVREALNHLDAGDRELLVALFHQGLPTEELASRLGVTPGALRVRKHRALKRLGILLIPRQGGGALPGDPFPDPGADSPGSHRNGPRRSGTF